MGLDAIDSHTLRALDSVRSSSPRIPADTPARPPEERSASPASEEASPENSGVPRRLGPQQSLPPNTRLHVDKETNQVVAQVLDENNEVIRQIPPEALLELSTRLSRLEGLLFNREF